MMNKIRYSIRTALNFILDKLGTDLSPDEHRTRFTCFVDKLSPEARQEVGEALLRRAGREIPDAEIAEVSEMVFQAYKKDIRRKAAERTEAERNRLNRRKKMLEEREEFLKEIRCLLLGARNLPDAATCTASDTAGEENLIDSTSSPVAPADGATDEVEAETVAKFDAWVKAWAETLDLDDSRRTLTPPIDDEAELDQLPDEILHAIAHWHRWLNVDAKRAGKLRAIIVRQVDRLPLSHGAALSFHGMCPPDVVRTGFAPLRSASPADAKQEQAAALDSQVIAAETT